VIVLLVVDVRLDALSEGATLAFKKTGIAGTERLTPALLFLTSENVRAPFITAVEKSTGFPFVCFAAAAISHWIAAFT